MEDNAILRIRHITKRFPGIVAVNDVSMDMYSGEVHAIIGENGAGKSTVCKMISGTYAPDGGEIYVNGEKKTFKDTSDAIAAGIGMLYQERNLIPNLTGAQNISLGFEPKSGGLISEGKIKKIAEDLREGLGINVPLDQPVGQMGAGMQQTIEIMRALRNKPGILILDEPTASLGEGEIEPFLKFVRQLVETENIAIIYISHKLEEIFQISDRISVLADGVLTLQGKTKDFDQDQVVSAMLRQREILAVDVSNKNVDRSEPLLVSGVSEYDGKNHSVPLTMYKGEAVGFYGLVGSGRTEWAEVLFGLRPAKKVDIRFRGKRLGNRVDTHQMIRAGLILTPEKRAHGIFRTGSLIFNVAALFIDQLSTKGIGMLKLREMGRFSEDVLKKHGVKYSDKNQAVAGLSGGNIQKIITGRSMELENVELLIFDEPTVGIDLGAKNDIYLKIRKLVEEENKGVIFISSELEELITVCDRICVFAEGGMVAEVDRAHFDKQQILDSAIRGRAVGSAMREVV